MQATVGLLRNDTDDSEQTTMLQIYKEVSKWWSKKDSRGARLQGCLGRLKKESIFSKVVATLTLQFLKPHPVPLHDQYSHASMQPST